MQLKYIKQAVLLFAISLILAMSAYLIKRSERPSNYQGERVFKTTMQPVSTIEFEAPNFQLTLDKIDNLWNIREIDSYYADYELIKDLENFINQAKILKKVNTATEQERSDIQNGLKITLYNSNQEQEGSVVLDIKNKISNNVLAQISGKQGTYLIETPKYLPLRTTDWLQQPALKIITHDIQEIIIDGVKATKVNGKNIFQTDNGELYTLRNIERVLNYLPFETVKSAQNFDESQYTPLKTYKITTKDGLIYTLTLYGMGQEIWLKEKISSTTLPTTKINDYIKRNEFLYNYWYFKLPSELGSALIRERLE